MITLRLLATSDLNFKQRVFYLVSDEYLAN